MGRKVTLRNAYSIFDASDDFETNHDLEYWTVEKNEYDDYSIMPNGATKNGDELDLDSWEETPANESFAKKIKDVDIESFLLLSEKSIKELIRFLKKNDIYTFLHYYISDDQNGGTTDYLIRVDAGEKDVIRFVIEVFFICEGTKTTRTVLLFRR